MRTAFAAHSDDVTLDAAVQLAAAAVLLLEGVEGGEQLGHLLERRVRARSSVQRREPGPATSAAPYVALLPTDSCYGHLWGLLFTPVQIVSSLFGSDFPGPVTCEPPFVLSLFPTGSAGKSQLESGPAAV